MINYSDRCVSNAHRYPAPAVVYGTYINGDKTMFCNACADSAEAYGMFTPYRDEDDNED